MAGVNPTSNSGSPNVAAQLEALGDAHIGYGSMVAADEKLVVAGARPFSKGGSVSDDVWAFYNEHYGVQSQEESVKRIVTSIAEQGLDELPWVRSVFQRSEVRQPPPKRLLCPNLRN